MKYIMVEDKGYKKTVLTFVSLGEALETIYNQVEAVKCGDLLLHSVSWNAEKHQLIEGKRVYWEFLPDRFLFIATTETIIELLQLYNATFIDVESAWTC